MAGYIIGIDQGTTTTTAVIIDENLNVLAKASIAHKQYYPQPGMVEHDPVEIYNNCIEISKKVLSMVPGAKPEDILGLGLDHQGETCLIWDKNTGVPVYNAIVWQDRRTSDYMEALKAECGEKIHQITGMLPDSYHSAAKLRWILDNVEGVRERAENGELLCGTLNTWIFWKLSKGEAFATDACSGNCQMLMDIRKTEWSDELIDLIGIPKAMMAEIKDNNSIYGYTDPDEFLGVRIPICGSIADGRAGLIGGGLIDPGIMKASYGTGIFLTLVCGEELKLDNPNVFTNCCWKIDGVANYNMAGACYTGAAAVEWMKDGLRIIDKPEDTETMSLSVPDTNGVYFVPAFAGLATPYWDQYARGSFMGLTAAVRREHMVRAVMEGIAYQTANCYRVLKETYGGEVSSMRVDGGMVENEFLMQFQADMLGIPVEVPVEKETAAYGSACLGALTLNIIDSLDEVKKKVKIKKAYYPQMDAEEREYRLNRWLEAVKRSQNWIESK